MSLGDLGEEGFRGREGTRRCAQPAPAGLVSGEGRGVPALHAGPAAPSPPRRRLTATVGAGQKRAPSGPRVPPPRPAPESPPCPAPPRRPPVIILTSTPSFMAFSRVSLVSGRGGSRKVRMPSICHLPSSLVLATARDRMPRRPRSMTFQLTRLATSSASTFWAGFFPLWRGAGSFTFGGETVACWARAQPTSKPRTEPGRP